jgi:hypothetical protein
MEKGSDKFEQALKDLNEIVVRGGLAQDKTANDSFKTIQSLIGDIIRIGGQEDLPYELITKRINQIFEPQRRRLDNLTLMDCLAMLLQGSRPDEHGAVKIPPYPDLPHDPRMTKILFRKTMEKFFSCNEDERRKITRSDQEFIQLVKDVIISRSGFRNEIETFGAEIPTTVPKIKRGKELLWHPSGEPEPEISSNDRELFSKFAGLTHIVLQKVEELYPGLYAKLREYYSGAIMATNADNPAFNKLANAKDEKEFNAIAIPAIIDALVISFLVRKDLYMNIHKRKHIRKRLIETVLTATVLFKDTETCCFSEPGYR